MWLESLGLVDFRNFTKQELNLDKKINLFIGDNAQGKTNIVEGIYLLATTKSFRTIKEAELIRWGATRALVKGSAGPNDIKILISQDNKKVFVNNQAKSRAYILGLLPVVLFSPESLSIVSGPPERRRRFLDQLLSTVNKNYLFTLSRYLKIIKNRNKLLWLIKQGKREDLSVWDKQLTSLGSYIWWYRLAFVEKANIMLKDIGVRLAGSKIQIDYRPTSVKAKDEKELRKFMGIELVKRKEEDVERGFTSFGPHRDDFRILFEVFRKDTVLEKDIGIFGSRGEQRIATLALKFVEVEFIEKNLGERPTLLLDDVLSEFDKTNREHIMRTFPKQQSVITTTSASLFPREFLTNVKIFEVRQGAVVEVNKKK